MQHTTRYLSSLCGGPVVFSVSRTHLLFPLKLEKRYAKIRRPAHWKSWSQALKTIAKSQTAFSTPSGGVHQTVWLY